MPSAHRVHTWAWARFAIMLFSLVCFHRFIVLFGDSLLLLQLLLLLLLLRSFHFTSLRSAPHLSTAPPLVSLSLSLFCLPLLVQCIHIYYNIIDWLPGRMYACSLLVGTNERTTDRTYKDRDIRCACVCVFVYNSVCALALISKCVRACAYPSPAYTAYSDIIYFI